METSSIIMTTFNRWNYAQQALASIFQNTKFPHKLIVVDNGSGDGTVEKLKELCKQDKIDVLLLLPENVGIAKGQNYGLKTSQLYFPQNRYLITTDNDLILPSNWLKPAILVLNNETIGHVGIRPDDIAPEEKVELINGVKVFESRSIGVSCFTIETLRKVGYYNEDMSFYAPIDMDFCRRVDNVGLRNVCLYDITCRHIQHYHEEEYPEYRAWKDRLLKEADPWKKFQQHFLTSVREFDVRKWRYAP